MVIITKLVIILIMVLILAYFLMVMVLVFKHKQLIMVINIIKQLQLFIKLIITSWLILITSSFIMTYNISSNSMQLQLLRQQLRLI